MAVFSIIGIGPGSREYIVPRAWEEAGKADTLVGSPRCLENFRELDKRLYPLGTEGYREAEEYIREHRETEKIAVLVAGDPGFHSYLAVLRRAFSPADYRVIPGISSVQIAFARIGRPWQDALLLSAHGREIPAVDTDHPLFFLTDRTNTPGKIAEKLLAGGSPDRTVRIFENLTYPDEHIETTRLSLIAGSDKEHSLCVMIVE